MTEEIDKTIREMHTDSLNRVYITWGRFQRLKEACINYGKNLREQSEETSPPKQAEETNMEKEKSQSDKQSLGEKGK